MQIEISLRNLSMTSEIRHWIERRVQFALGRFAAQIERITVTCSDLNGDRGGVDKECRLRLVLKSGGELVVEDRDASLEVVAASVADRAGRTLARRLERLREFSNKSASGSEPPAS